MKQKNTLHNIWDMFSPVIIYYLLHTAAYILLAALVQSIGEPYQSELVTHTETVTGLVSGLSMVIAVLPLLPLLRRELVAHSKSVRDTGRMDKAAEEQNVHSVERQGRDRSDAGRRGAALVLTILLAVLASLGLNVLLSLTGLVELSAGYRDVAARQYGVLFGLGMLLYGLISPVTEEIVFRGLLFNRMRRYLPHAAAVVASGVLFGIYHGNLVQGLYGGCMGILMAYLYERLHSFLFPCLFHAAANLTVYIIAQNAALHARIFTPSGCALLLLCAALCIVAVEKIAADIE